MKTRRIPQRTCVGCGTVRNKNELIRIVHTPENEFLVDPGGRKNGRGAYLCPNPACLQKAARSGALSRAFGTPVPAQTLEAIRKEMEALV